MMGINPFRREFLKSTGTGIVGIAAGAIVTPGAHATPRPLPEEERRSAYDVRTFGATGNGTTLDSPAINKAIEAASAVVGGTVRFPAGTYLSYSIQLKSNIALYLELGATVLAASVPVEGRTTNTYDLAESNALWENYQDFGHNHWHNCLIWGENLENIAILGTGLLWGKGLLLKLLEISF